MEKDTPERIESDSLEPTEAETVKPKETKLELSQLEQELAELRAFKAGIEAKAKEVSENVNVKDTFLSTHEQVAPKPKTNTDKFWEEMLEKGAFYRK